MISPSREVKTIRRAISPTICFTTAIRRSLFGSASTIVFDSFCSEAWLCFIALMNLPFLYSMKTTRPSHGLPTGKGYDR